jgi:hypothetical protein
MRVLGVHVNEIDGSRAGERDCLDAVQQKLRGMKIKWIEGIEKSRGLWKGELKGVGMENRDVIAGVRGRLPLDEVLPRDGDQRGMEFHANDAAKRKVGG